VELGVNLNELTGEEKDEAQDRFEETVQLPDFDDLVSDIMGGSKADLARSIPWS
jgi:hypothetical protein